MVLGVGLALRIYFMFVWRPAITGYSDSGIYFQDSVQSLWTDPIRTVGYSMFLRVLHGITPHLIFVTIVQHALGLLTATIYFVAVRRSGGPRLLGLAPAAMIALGGDQLFMEHSALSDSLLIFIVSVTLYCALRASGGQLWWAALAGVAAGLGVWDRGAGLVMVAIVASWLLFSAGRPTRRTLASGLVALIASLAMIGVYIGWREEVSGSAASPQTTPGTSTGGWVRGPTATSSPRRPEPKSCVNTPRPPHGDIAAAGTDIYMTRNHPPGSSLDRPMKCPNIPTR